MKALPYGISDFSPPLDTENYYYIDKTCYIGLIERNHPISF